MQLLKKFKFRLIPSLVDALVERKIESRQLPEFFEEVFMPGQNSDFHNGFVNSNRSAHGLGARFFRTSSDGIGVIWENNRAGFEGYPGIIHGGITAALIDETMSYAAFHKTNHFGVTVKASIQWHKTLKISDTVKGYAEAVFVADDLVNVSAYLIRGDGKTIVSGNGLFYIPTLKQFKRLAELDSVPAEVQKHFRP